MKWLTHKFIYTLSVALLTLLMFTGVSLAAEETGIVCQGHVSYDGWLPAVTNSGVVGTIDQGKRLEAFQATFPTGVAGIRYCAYVSDIGWQDWASNGTLAGTIGQSKMIEAFKMELIDQAAEMYDIYYRAYVSNIGWLEWAGNGQVVGTTGLSMPIEAIEFRVVAKNTAFAASSSGAYIDGTGTQEITYSSHVSYDGWQAQVSSGQTSGTTGEGKAVEAINISAPHLIMSSAISYQTQVQNIGWLDWVQGGTVSGTEGQGLSVEGFRVVLQGTEAAVADIYYRAHVQYIGWLDWAKNGELAGTEGLSLPMEAYEVVIVPKNAPAPGSTNGSYINSDILAPYTGVTSRAHVENIGWMDPVPAGGDIGTQGQSLGIEGLEIKLDTLSQSSIVYNTYIENIGWQGEQSNGATAGLPGTNQQMEAITICLSGPAHCLFDIYYQVHSEDYGWLDWACNGEWAGTSCGNRKMEALRVVLVPKGTPAPGKTDVPYIQAEPKVELITAEDVPDFDLICAIVQHEGGESYTSALAVMSCVMNRCDSGRWGGKDPVSVLTAPGQFTSYLGGYYRQFLGHTSPSVQQAVLDCLNGTRSHPYESFRAYPTAGSVCIGGNWYF